MSTQIATSQDAFLDGKIRALQPKKGFRAGLDSVLLAASLNRDSETVLELGAGVGVAACCALAELPQLTAVLTEIDEPTLELAQQNLKNNGLETRAQTILLDITQKGAIRSQAGLDTDTFSSVIANPPYFDARSGTTPPQSERAKARHMGEKELDKWVKTAAASAAPLGEIIFIHSVTALPDLISAFSGRFGEITILPIVSRPGQNANRVLVRGIKASRAPLKLLSPLILHGPEGRGFTPMAEKIFRGKSRLHW